MASLSLESRRTLRTQCQCLVALGGGGGEGRYFPQPHLFKNCSAKCPKPPMPTTATLSVGLTPYCMMGLNTVMPPQRVGLLAAWAGSQGVYHGAGLSTDFIGKAAMTLHYGALGAVAEVMVAA